MILQNVRTLLICALVQIGSVFFVAPVCAQQQERSTSELGLGIGGVVYKGDVAPRYRFLSNRPALTVFYKKDMSRALALRGSLLLGRITAKDEQYAERHPLADFRKATVTTSMLELAAGIDYNFLDYYDFRRRVRWTPYFTLGVAGLVYNNKTTAVNPEIIYPANNNSNDPYRTSFALAVPIGVGAKYALSHRWNLGLEFGARMLFTDDFDNLSLQNERVMNQHDKDWYFYNGISISYTFYRINCPTF
ncbi:MULTISPECIES: DUF6089 family protein [Rufibacter]|uniref:Opacity protein-like surface antigen n=1 Tax=Rufibacter quisquiliarum TaxID=1549639 RepID=A0A839GTI0_9BACT|nr:MULTISPECIES: DUF6089 family protein [Rufibacter]MBA9077718.1 opacity protein-like surface antigen [Rufibacter quisquiliarum]